MERKKASDFPQEVLNLFDKYVHGDISRREFLDGAKKFAVGGLTVAAIFESLRPNYAWAEQVPKNDKRIKAEYATYQSPQGNGAMKGYLVRPSNGRGKLPGIVVVHENRGLNPYIEDVARRLAVANFLAYAPDALTPVGGYPGDDEKGAQLFGQVDAMKRVEDVVAERPGELVGFAHAIEAALAARERGADRLRHVRGVGARGASEGDQPGASAACAKQGRLLPLRAARSAWEDPCRRGISSPP